MENVELERYIVEMVLPADRGPQGGEGASSKAATAGPLSQHKSPALSPSFVHLQSSTTSAAHLKPESIFFLPKHDTFTKTYFLTKIRNGCANDIPLFPQINAANLRRTWMHLQLR